MDGISIYELISRFDGMSGSIPGEVGWFEASPRNLERLMQSAVERTNPRPHVSCDWIGLILKEQLWLRFR
jgi:hypothetical protein